MGMRVIAGKYRHRNLSYPDNNPNIRPTKDRIREAFFSSLGDITGLSFLDLFAGSGSMGIEAISRGASKGYFVDNNKNALGYIKNNISALGIKNADITFMNALDALKNYKDKGIKFDIIYIDPPYESGLYDEILSYIYNNDLLNIGAIVAFEADRKINVDTSWYKNMKEYKYGDIFVTVLRS